MTKLGRGRTLPFILENFLQVYLFLFAYLSLLNKVEILSESHVMLSQLTTVRKKEMLCSTFFFTVSKSQGSEHKSHTIHHLRSDNEKELPERFEQAEP